jgi:diguanylate cyclase (GGDEF)-like protein/PAS domain S-box-containing protein
MGGDAEYPYRPVMATILSARAHAKVARPEVGVRPAAAAGVVGVALFMVLTAFDVGGQEFVWENAHWTAAGLVATIAAFVSARRTHGRERHVRLLVTASAGAWLVGQLIWDVQTAIGFFAVPSPSDIGFLTSAVPATAAIALAVHGRLSRAEELAVYLDAAVIFGAISALILTIFGSAALAADPLAAAIAIAYPIVHLATAGAGLVGLLSVRSPVRIRGGYLVLIGFALLGIAWVEWLRMALLGLPPAGAPANYVFSIGVLCVGFGGATWQLDTTPPARTRTLASIVAGGLPMAGLAVAAAVLLAHDHPGASSDLVDGFALGVILVAGLRQTILIHERGRLLDSSVEAHEELEVAMRQRAEADTRYQALVEHVPAAVYIDMADPDVTDGGRLAYMSPQIEDILGYPPEAFVDDPELWPALIHEEDRDAALAAYLDHWGSGRTLRLEYRMTARDGSVVWISDEAYAIADEATGEHRQSQGIVVDTTERKRLEAQLIHDALHDPLTGLANRVLFREHLERALARRTRGRSRTAILFLDLDDFKVVNDSLGHRAGDRLLSEVAGRLSQAIRSGDVAARQGGDEFTILLDRVKDAPGAIDVAERLALELRRPIDVEGRGLVIGASIGIAVSDGSTGADDLLAHADAAMYEAKALGKGRHALFDPSMRLRARIRLEMEAELRAAIEARSLVLHYQPIVELETGTVVGFEALVRWPHPERGLLPPSDFIGLAEASGLIEPLGRLVLEQACRDLGTWRASELDRAHLAMSVNVSPRQTVVPGFASDVRDILAATATDPSALTLEITESLIMPEAGSSAEVLRTMRALGVRIAVDDFATGFSALEYFKRFSVDELKIDRAFVAGLGSSAEDTAIVTATLAFASALGIDVTAEGVEAADQADRLRALGCRRAQGYHFARPMPAGEVEAFLAGWAGGSQADAQAA